jgi:hypothetical protein
MHELTIYPPTDANGIMRLCIAHCDKDGAILSARLASALGGISSPRPLQIRPDRYTDPTFFRDTANALAGLYKLASGSALLNPKTVVLSSVHRAALYIAEALHAPLLPLQLISFSKTIEQAQLSQVLSIVGSDYGVNELWQWNKIAEPSQFPDSYVEMLKEAENVILVRSNDFDADCPIEGKIGKVYVNRSLRVLNPRLWDTVSHRLEETGKDFSNLHQWEWGLPDATLSAAKSLWKTLGKDVARFHCIESSTVDLYRLISPLWENYLLSNEVHIRGVTINAYWTAHPYFERYAGLVPVHYYKFSFRRDDARTYLEKYGRTHPSPDRICVFSNDAGGYADHIEVQNLITEMGLQQNCWFSIGYDCPGAECHDSYGEPIPNPFQKVSEWIKTSPYRKHKWKPLEIDALLPFIKRDTP